MLAGGPVSRKGFPGSKYEKRVQESENGCVREATSARPDS